MIHRGLNRERFAFQDLLREIDPSGVDTIDRAVTEKVEARAKRFNLKNGGANVTFDDFVKLYQRLVGSQSFGWALA